MLIKKDDHDVSAEPNDVQPKDQSGKVSVPVTLAAAISEQLKRLPSWFVGVLLLVGTLGYLLKEAMPLLLRALGK